jgi:hypothetical protein
VSRLWSPFALLLAACDAPPVADGLADALARARAADGLVLVQFTAKDRPLAQRMERETLADQDVRNVLGGEFVPVLIDSDRSPALFAELVGGKGALATCVLDRDGELVAAREGFLDADHLLGLLRTARARAGLLREVRERVRVDPDDLEARYHYAEALSELTTRSHAERAFEVLIAWESRIDPRDERSCQVLARGHERLARLRARAGLAAGARLHLERFRALDPRDRTGRMDRILISEAMVLSSERRSSEALVVLADCERRFPRSVEADLRLVTEAVAWHELDERNRALQRLDAFFLDHGDSPYGEEATLTREHVLAPPHGH